MSNTDKEAAPGLYIHIPFCRKKCSYCDFYSVTSTGFIDEFLNALYKEMELYRDTFTRFDTIYLGGGTPSLLAPRQIEVLLRKIRASFAIEPDPEITMEVNPADWNREDMRMVREAGINRISIGIQSFNDTDLSFLCRRHTSEEALNTLDEAGCAGFDNISLDLMYGLPGQVWEDWHRSLSQAVQFHPAHLSCYELELKDNTPLGRRLEAGEFTAPTEDSQRDFFIHTSELLENSGYIHYEISNFAAGMDKVSRHNSKYWDHTPYLGLGPSAHSFQDNRRWWNHASLDDYLHDLDMGTPPVSGDESLTREQLCMEAAFLALRTRTGIDAEQFRGRYGYDLLREKSAELELWSREGLIEIKDGFIRPTRAGMAVADCLVLF